MGAVVVGVDGSPGSLAALRFAADEARLRGAAVKAIFAWSVPVTGDISSGLLPQLRADLAEEGAKALDEALGQIDATGLTIERVVEEGSAAHVLVEAAREAELLVVGSRGHGGFTGLLLGSTSRQCSHQASCPVVIVRAHEER
jgi:nucleotide-binding universal stress UspA family protein